MLGAMTRRMAGHRPLKNGSVLQRRRSCGDPVVHNFGRPGDGVVAVADRRARAVPVRAGRCFEVEGPYDFRTAALCLA